MSEAGLEEILSRAGYREGRVEPKVQDWARELRASDGFEIFPAAQVALTSFGGLLFRPDGPGRDFARCTLRMDPMLAEGEGERFRGAEAILRQRLFPLGDLDFGHAFLAIAEDGTVVTLMETTTVVAKGVRQALRSLLLGERSECWRELEPETE